MVKWKKYRRDVKQSPEWPWLTMMSAVDSRTKKIDEEVVRELEGIAMPVTCRKGNRVPLWCDSASMTCVGRVVSITMMQPQVKEEEQRLLALLGS